MPFHLPIRSFVNKKKPIAPERPKMPSNVSLEGGEIKVGDKVSVGKGYVRAGEASVGGGEIKIGDRAYVGKGEVRAGNVSIKRGSEINVPERAFPTLASLQKRQFQQLKKLRERKKLRAPYPRRPEATIQPWPR